MKEEIEFDPLDSASVKNVHNRLFEQSLLAKKTLLCKCSKCDFQSVEFESFGKHIAEHKENNMIQENLQNFAR